MFSEPGAYSQWVGKNFHTPSIFTLMYKAQVPQCMTRWA